MTDQEFLAHYGILGMKWGRRKGGSSTTKEASEDHKTTRSLKKKSVSEMTNKELETLTRRMQLEKQYKDLKKNDISKGKNIVDSILKTAKTANEIYNLYNSPMGKAVKAHLNKKS